MTTPEHTNIPAEDMSLRQMVGQELLAGQTSNETISRAAVLQADHLSEALVRGEHPPQAGYLFDAARVYVEGLSPSEYARLPLDARDSLRYARDLTGQFSLAQAESTDEHAVINDAFGRLEGFVKGDVPASDEQSEKIADAFKYAVSGFAFALEKRGNPSSLADSSYFREKVENSVRGT